MFHHRGPVIWIPISNLYYALAIGGTIFLFLQLNLDLIQRESAGYSAHPRIIRKEVLSEENERDLLIVNDELLIETTNTFASYSRPMIPTKEVVAVMVLCEGTPDNSTSSLTDISRQFFQAHTAMKSFVYLSNQPVKFIIVSDSQNVFEKIKALSESWPHEQKSKLTLQFVSNFYPDEFKGLEKLFRPCASQRIFFDHVLPEEDAVIYMDTDVIFMRSPVHLWNEFKRFDDKQMMAAALPTWTSIKRNDDAAQQYEFDGRGFNSGILLLNLTRVRNTPEFWLKNLRLAVSNLDLDDLSDQDYLNFMFNQAPEHFYELECNWNFRWPACRNFTTRCPEIMERGPYLVHGIGGSFLNDEKHPKMATLAEKWDAWNMSLPLETLINILTETLPTAVSRYGHCSKVQGFNEALIKQLVLHNSENISL